MNLLCRIYLYSITRTFRVLRTLNLRTHTLGYLGSWHGEGARYRRYSHSVSAQSPPTQRRS